MAKKVTSSRPKNAGSYTSRSFKKPQWMKTVRLVFIILLGGLALLAVIGKIIHLTSHFK